MKKLLLALVLVVPAFGVLASSSSSPSSSSSNNGSLSGRHSESYQVCYIDGKAIMLQQNMCYAKGGSLVKPN
ncbi:hypothetical protein [Photobacterium rosenbergii]|uniref:DUF1496 domain-containing protein n=1 Tax=Photobacterium rosenbergii TaxID=294936 RepID=A0ABU3ZQG0_9GAMM|nr:hypothetical protein [Photobacterium rosenbergii]MBY5945225.1 hypothetical protein [Photobacterium rosenbergii]MDV5172168.1 hypothetical protein [Photobacterium rosenbergii]